MRSIQKKKIFLIENGEGVENMVNIKKIKQAVSIVLTGEYPKVCVNLQTDVR